MKSLYFQNDMTVDQAYIIRVKNHEISEKLAKRCADSCDEVGQKYQFWDAFNGLGTEIQPPAQYSDIVKMVKVTDHYLTRGEVACALSHISLWAHCVLIDKPIVILEHDAIMLQPYTGHGLYNSIAYLGGREQYLQVGMSHQFHLTHRKDRTIISFVAHTRMQLILVLQRICCHTY